MSRSAQEARIGQAGGNIASFIKYYNSEQNKRKYELFLEIMGTLLPGWADAEFSVEELDLTRQRLRSRANSLESGTSEVQLNVLAKRIFELPE